MFLGDKVKEKTEPAKKSVGKFGRKEKVCPIFMGVMGDRRVTGMAPCVKENS